MSVTFTIESLPTGSFVIECHDEKTGAPVVVATADSYEGILVQREAHMATCEECSAYGCYSSPVMDVSGDLDVNLSNTNAIAILSALGISDEAGDSCGSLDAEQFLGAVLLAMASDRDDSGAPAAVIAGGTVSPGATMVDCGIPSGYYAARFASLHALASEAVRLGRPIVWS